jgi:hypothetical protein
VGRLDAYVGQIAKVAVGVWPFEADTGEALVIPALLASDIEA